MSTRKSEKRHIRNIQKTRGSYLVTIPFELVRKFKWKERQKVEVREQGAQKILIQDWKK